MVLLLSEWLCALSCRQIATQTNLMMLAGYETTANTLAFCIYLLGKNPHAQQQLLQEVDGFKVLKCIVCRCTCTIVCICPQARCANEHTNVSIVFVRIQKINARLFWAIVSAWNHFW